MICPVCLGEEHLPYTVVRGYEIRRCAGCHAGVVYPIPDDDTIHAIYGRDYFEEGGQGYRDYVGDEPIHRSTAAARLDALARFRRDGALLDVGCAAGFLLDEARERGFTVRGIELCDEMAVIARSLRTASW